MANRIEFEAFVNPAGFKKGLAEMEASADATNMRLQNMLRSKLSGVEARMSGMEANGWEYILAAQNKARLEKRLLEVQNAMYLRNATARAEISKREVAATATAESEKVAANRAALSSITAAEREQAILEQHLMDESVAKNAAAAAAKAEANKMAWIAGQSEWRKIQEVQTAEMLANFEAQRVSAAALKAEQLSLIASVAMGNGAGVSAGGHGGHGGLSGIIRESLVIVRELSMGRGFGRVAGSVTLLAQYMGLLGTVVKSTALEALKASASVSKLSFAMSTAAYAAEAKAAASMEANVATGGLIVATRLQAEADGEAAIAARASAVAQEAKAVASADAAKMALASATVSISAIGWIIAAVVLLGAAIFAVAWHFHTLAVRAKNLADLLDPLKKKFTDEADAVRNAAKAHQEYIDELKKTSQHTESLVDQTDALIKKIKEQSAAQIELAEARGASHVAIERMQESELRKEAEITKKALDKATAERNYQTLEVAKAESAYNANSKVDIKGTQGAARNAGSILDAVQAAMEAKGTITTGGQITGGSSLSGFTREPFVTRKANEDDEFTVKIDGKEITTTVAKAKAAYTKLSDSAQELETAQTKLKDVFENSKSTLKEKNEAVKNLSKADKDYNDQLGIKSTTGRRVAAAQDAKKFGSGAGSDSMVKVGNFLGTARSGINSLAEQQVKLAEESLAQLKMINVNMGTHHDRAGGATFSAF